MTCFLCQKLIGLTADISNRENYDFDQVKSIAKVEVRFPFNFKTGPERSLFQFATLLHAAGFDLPEH